MTYLNDHEIIRLFFERSEHAVACLIVKYETAIRKVASCILKDPQDVEECVNDTYLQIWNTVPPQQPKSLGAFSCRVARNIALNKYHFNSARKRNSYYDAALDELSGSIPSLTTVESEYDAKELAESINRFLRGLPPEERYLFMHRYWLGAAVSEIAKSLNVTAHAVSVRLFRIRKKLNKHLKKEGGIA